MLLPRSSTSSRWSASHWSLRSLRLSATVGDQSIDFVGLKNFREVLNDNVSPRHCATRSSSRSFRSIVLVLANILALVLLADFSASACPLSCPSARTTPIALGVLGWFWMFDPVYSPIDFLLREVGLLGVGTLRPRPERVLAGDRSGPRLRAHGAHLAHVAAGNDHPARRVDVDPAGRQGRRQR